MTKDELFEIRVDEPDEKYMRATKDVFDSLAKPLDGFGEFENMICRIAAMQRTSDPDVSSKALIIMCADNGVVKEGVTQTDFKVTSSVASLMGKGMSSVCVMLRESGVKVIPVDIGIDSDEMIRGVRDKKIASSTGNIRKEQAMEETQCIEAIAAGIDTVNDCVSNGIKIIATGEMGIGNTTTSTALFCAFTGEEPQKITGRGAGLSDEGLVKKIRVIEDALKLHGLYVKTGETVSKEYALKALSSVGGLDIAGLAGVFTGAALNHIPVVIDGAISAVSALAASFIVPGCEAYMLSSHSGKEACTGEVLKLLGLKSVINADMALGEGSGAVMLFPLLDMVMNVYRSGTRFAGSGIRQYERFCK